MLNLQRTIHFEPERTSP